MCICVLKYTEICKAMYFSQLYLHNHVTSLLTGPMVYRYRNLYASERKCHHIAYGSVNMVTLTFHLLQSPDKMPLKLSRLKAAV